MKVESRKFLIDEFDLFHEGRKLDDFALYASGEMTRRFLNTTYGISKGFFEMIDEACKLLKIPERALVPGKSAMRISLIGSSTKHYELKKFPSYENFKKEIQKDLQTLKPSKISFLYGRDGGFLSNSYEEKIYLGSVGFGYDDFTANEIVQNPLDALDDIFNLPSEHITDREKERVRRHIECSADTAAGVLKRSYISTDLGMFNFFRPKPVLEGLSMKLLRYVTLMWEQKLYFKNKFEK